MLNLNLGSLSVWSVFKDGYDSIVYDFRYAPGVSIKVGGIHKLNNHRVDIGVVARNRLVARNQPGVVVDIQRRVNLLLVTVEKCAFIQHP